MHTCAHKTFVSHKSELNVVDVGGGSEIHPKS